MEPLEELFPVWSETSFLEGRKKYRATRLFFCAFFRFSFGVRESEQATQRTLKRSLISGVAVLLITEVASGLDTNSLECL